MQNRVRWHLHELDPELHLPAGALSRASVLHRLTRWAGEQATHHPGSLVVALVTELLTDIHTRTGRITALEREISARVEQTAPQLLGLLGVGGLTAAKIIGETANVTRFRSEACYAMHTGTAPIPASSGRRDRHRINRGGNRQLNAALHRIAITQIRVTDSPGQRYYQRRRAHGDTSRDAIRALKRHLARTVFNLLKAATTTDLPAAA